MDSTKQKGQEGEDIACAFLLENKYKIIERNWHFSKYEVDIIVENKDTLVFVEVKFRTGNYFGEPEVFVSAKQKLNLIRVANYYIDKKDISKEARFDIIAIVKNKGQITINHIEDAFKPEVNQD
jgi:putative endonuclease